MLVCARVRAPLPNAPTCTASCGEYLHRGLAPPSAPADASSPESSAVACVATLCGLAWSAMAASGSRVSRGAAGAACVGRVGRGARIAYVKKQACFFFHLAAARFIAWRSLALARACPWRCETLRLRARPPAPHGLLRDGAPGPAELLPVQQEERLHCRALHRRRVHCCLSARGTRGERRHCAAAERPGARAGRSLSRPAAAPGAGARAGGAGGCRGRGGRAGAGALPGGHCRAAGAAAGGGRRRLRALLFL